MSIFASIIRIFLHIDFKHYGVAVGVGVTVDVGVGVGVSWTICSKCTETSKLTMPSSKAIFVSATSFNTWSCASSSHLTYTLIEEVLFPTYALFCIWVCVESKYVITLLFPFTE